MWLHFKSTYTDNLLRKSTGVRVVEISSIREWISRTGSSDSSKRSDSKGMVYLRINSNLATYVTNAPRRARDVIFSYYRGILMSFTDKNQLSKIIKHVICICFCSPGDSQLNPLVAPHPTRVLSDFCRRGLNKTQNSPFILRTSDSRKRQDCFLTGKLV